MTKEELTNEEEVNDKIQIKSVCTTWEEKTNQCQQDAQIMTISINNQWMTFRRFIFFINIIIEIYQTYYTSISY